MERTDSKLMKKDKIQRKPALVEEVLVVDLEDSQEEEVEHIMHFIW